MSDRWRPKRLIRARAAAIAAGGVPRSQIPACVLVAPKAIPFAACTHDYPWRSCALCSKPRADHP